MRLALIPPVKLVEDIRRTDYQLLLPHVRSTRYRLAYQYKPRSDFTILDNGAAEESQVTGAYLIGFAELMGVSEIAIPDVLFDNKTSFDLLKRFIQENRDILQPLVDKGMRLGFVAQGRSEAEAEAMIDWVAKFDHDEMIKTVYLPRLLIRRFGPRESRLRLSATIDREYGNRFQQHLFGASVWWPDELQHAAQLGWIRGMDTSLPYNATLAGITLETFWKDLKHDPNGLQRLSRPQGYFELPSSRFDPELQRANVQTVLDWAKGTW